MATWPKNPDGTYMDRASATTFSSVYGSQDRPGAPRSILTQSGSRKVVLTWDLPNLRTNVKGYKIYTGTEKSLAAIIRDGNVRQYSLDASSGTTPPTQNIFISSFTSAGIESYKAQVQGAAIAETSAPPDPPPPAGSPASGDTGVKGDASSGFIDDSGFTR